MLKFGGIIVLSYPAFRWFVFAGSPQE